MNPETMCTIFKVRRELLGSGDGKEGYEPLSARVLTSSICFCGKELA
jgi:hypothetical protein